MSFGVTYVVLVELADPGLAVVVEDEDGGDHGDSGEHCAVTEY